MEYNKFIEYVIIGHEFIGYIDNQEFKILNVYDDVIVVKISSEVNQYPYDEIEKTKIYDNKTFKELFDLDLVEIHDMF